MKILVLCGDCRHHPQIARAGLSAFKGKEFTFDWIEDARDWSPELMMMYPVVILTKSDNVSAGDRTGWMTDGVQAARFGAIRPAPFAITDIERADKNH